MPSRRFPMRIPVLAAFLLGLPLLGAWLAGKPLAAYLEFPPLTRHVPHAEFSWGVFAAMATGILGFLAWFGSRLLEEWRHCPATPGQEHRETIGCRRDFPGWGWLGLGLVILFWGLSWTRFGWFAPVQKYTFVPLWLGYILVVNALAVRRTGRCLLTHRTGWYLRLFPASALFWWFFEYLNRFVQNWYYLGAEGMGPVQYTVIATLSFSTVLPAVLGTMELLGSFRPFDRVAPPPDGPAPENVRKQFRTLAFGLLAVSVSGLAGIGIWPDLLFPLLWLAPLGLLVGCWMLKEDGRTILRRLMAALPRGHGNPPATTLALLMLSGLVCGFFWELWNLLSLAKWIYAIPFVDRFHLFEMPLLGYAGYLPFGIECAAAAAWLSDLSAADGGSRSNITIDPSPTKGLQP